MWWGHQRRSHGSGRAGTRTTAGGCSGRVNWWRQPTCARSAFSPCPSSLPASLSWRHGGWCSQQMSCVARAKLFACDLGPIVYTHKGQECLLASNARAGRGEKAAKGLLSLVRAELNEAAAPLPGLAVDDLDVLCRCANPGCCHLVDGKPPLLFSWSATCGPRRTAAALRRGRANYRNVTGLPLSEPCRLMCDGCAHMFTRAVYRL